MRFTLFGAKCTGNAANTSYPLRLEIASEAQLREAVLRDHVCAEYKNNYRADANFLRSDVIPMDVDNQGEEESKWITPERMTELFPDYCMAIVASRNNEKSKHGEKPRPRFHVFFSIEQVVSVDVYKQLKVRLQARYPFFDKEALGGSRFLFGAEPDFVLWQDGKKCIDELLLDESDFDCVQEGSRNTYMSQRAAGIIKHYGDTDEVHERFFLAAGECNPPLAESELATIWRSAQKFFHVKVETDPNYLPQEQFEKGFLLLPEDNSDVGQAVVMAREYGSCLRYSPSTDFIVYNGSYWEESKPKAQGFPKSLRIGSWRKRRRKWIGCWTCWPRKAARTWYG